MALLAQLLEALLSKHPEIRAADLRGGDKRNAIAREAQATVLVRCFRRTCSPAWQVLLFSQHWRGTCSLMQL